VKRKIVPLHPNITVESFVSTVIFGEKTLKMKYKASISSHVHLCWIYLSKNRRKKLMLNYVMVSRFSSRIAIALLLVVAAFVLVACGTSATVALPPHTPSASVSFSKDVLPILQNQCVSCHGGQKTSKGLDLKAYASMMAGSQSGAVIVSGDAAKSMLIQSIQLGKMPKRGGPLPADQILLLMDWVNAGAKNN
jgi:hypothetical protein